MRQFTSRLFPLRRPPLSTISFSSSTPNRQSFPNVFQRPQGIPVSVGVPNALHTQLLACLADIKKTEHNLRSDFNNLFAEINSQLEKLGNNPSNQKIVELLNRRTKPLLNEDNGIRAITALGIALSGSEKVTKIETSYQRAQIEVETTYIGYQPKG